MFKKITKETIIILLLLLAILLVLGIFLYDYIPTSKIVPKVEAYQVPESIQKELSETVNEEKGQVVVTYEIDDRDLNLYEKGKDYKKGKANPFMAEETAQTNTTTNANTINNNTTSGNTTTKNPDAVGNYLPSSGTK